MSIFMESPKYSHWQVVKSFSRYVSGTKDLVIMYSTSYNFKLNGYTHNDNGGNINDNKITFGYTFHFGTSFLSCDLKKQPILTLFSTESEYVTVIGVACQDIWMQRILKDIS